MIRPIAYIVTALTGLLMLVDNEPQTVNLQAALGVGLFVVGYIGGIMLIIKWLAKEAKKQFGAEW